MVEIKEVVKESIANNLSILEGDILCSINYHEIRDEIDLMFYENDENIEIEIERGKKRRLIQTSKLPEERLGNKLKPWEFKRYNNSCNFCIYDQMPRNLTYRL